MEFFIKYKKILMAIGFIAIVFILGYALYAVFFKPVIPPDITTEPTKKEPEAGGLPTAGEGAGQIITPEGQVGLPEESAKTASSIANGGITHIEKLNNTESFAPTISSNGSDVQFYNKEDGKFYRINKNGQIEALTDKAFYSVEKVVWSGDKNKAILEYPDGANIIYNFSTNQQATLPTHWKDFDFSPTGDKIVMKSMGIDTDNRWLAITNEDGSKARSIEALGDKDSTVYPSWSPSGQSIAMYVEGIDFDRQELFFVGLNNENFKSTIIEGRGFMPKWSPNGDRLLYSVYSSSNDLKPLLWITNAQGESIGTGRKNLNIETWANKCIFANNTELYCAVPEKLEEGAGIFPELALNTRDNLYKIDTLTGIKKLIAVPDGNYNISNPIISDNGQYLYFTDATSGRLYNIKLK